jgi:hypothetical protein
VIQSSGPQSPLTKLRDEGGDHAGKAVEEIVWWDANRLGLITQALLNDSTIRREELPQERRRAKDRHSVRAGRLSREML